MKKLAISMIVLLLANAAVSAQKTGTLRWEDELCTFEGTFNASLYTKEQLAATYRLWRSQDFNMDTFDAAAFDIDGIEKLRTTASLDEEYARKSAELKMLNIVKAPYWENVRQRKLKELEQDYKLARASVQAYRNPAALEREINYADACIARFAPPLTAGGDALLKIWREVNEENRRKNASPENIRRKFETQLASADRFKYAQVEVITFGWWNCVNERIVRVGDFGELDKNYRKLFRRVREINCDEP